VKRASSSGRKRAPRAPGDQLFENPRLYDLAFGFRDVKQQCDGLLALCRRYGVAAPNSVLELACGPGNHLREFARRGLRALGVDNNREMLAYGRSLAKRDGVDVTFELADMRTFSTGKRVDLALCLFDSFCHCATDADAIATLRATGRALKPGGLLILELTHPADFFGKSPTRAVPRWTQRYPDVVVTTTLRHTRTDPIAETHVPSLTIEARYLDGRPARRIVDQLFYRMWFRSGIAHVALASGCFAAVGWHGDVDPAVPLDMSDEAWQMVVVLRRL
jgi:SAM-dependent methyltransferase